MKDKFQPLLDNKYIEVIANIGSYKPRFVIQRLVIIALASVILCHIAILLTEGAAITKENKFLGYVVIILAFNSASEINILLAMFLRRIELLHCRIVPQALIIFIITIAVTYAWTRIAERIFCVSELMHHGVTQFAIILGFFLLLVMHILIMMSSITKEWMESRKEVERLKHAKLQSDYNSLQDRLDPHFLFNNLSVLKSLIRYSPEDAETFTQNFTDVYRYLLRSHESPIVSVANELEFLESYIALHKERLGEGLIVNIDVGEAASRKVIPPMSIQLLVENAIKHNVVSRSHPLHINIYSDESTLTVENKINKKEMTYSTHTGLKTLQAQYELIARGEVEIQLINEVFLVRIPLL